MGNILRGGAGVMLYAVDRVAVVVNEYVFGDIPGNMQYQSQLR